jgi:hypothetical protein
MLQVFVQELLLSIKGSAHVQFSFEVKYNTEKRPFVIYFHKTLSQRKICSSLL